MPCPYKIILGYGDGIAHWCQLKKFRMRSHEQFCDDRLIRQLTCAAGTQAGLKSDQVSECDIGTQFYEPKRSRAIG
ncbi:MAG: hypothetical protein QQW96_21010 [Tychonema bourrellyi B0820]|nr:hypothetical protein [Tychonema bourrellyi B0820]